MLKVKALEICRDKHQQNCDFKNLNFVLKMSRAGNRKALLTTDTFSIP